jgi:hypothetical protein
MGSATQTLVPQGPTPQPSNPGGSGVTLPITLADVTGLIVALAAKAGLPIAQADVTGLVAALAAKATLPIAQVDVTGLVAALLAKAPVVGAALEDIQRLALGLIGLVSVHPTTLTGGTGVFVGVNPPIGGITITLPPDSECEFGDVLIIKDAVGTAGTRTITVEGNPGDFQSIDGGTTVTITAAFGVVRLSYKGSGWLTW